jgi:hypothetical protein
MKKHIVYKITNNINQRYYIGVHSTFDINDLYMGSGKLIKDAIVKYGISNFTKEILFEFDSIFEAYEKEKELVSTTYSDPKSYNMNTGGKGGWGHINTCPNKTQPMHNPEIAKKVSDSLKKKYQDDPEHRSCVQKSQKLATAASVLVNTGKKRPEHSMFMRNALLEGKIKMTCPIRTPSTFEVFSPIGEVFIVYNLQEFCYNNGLPYTSLWKTHISELPCKKGKAKNWKCKLIDKGKYEKRN